MTTPIITKAVNILRAGGLVAFPTETVYGLGGDATNPLAIKRIFAAKERPYNHPLIVHIADISQLADWAFDVSPNAMKLAKAFWPGPLTLVLKKKRHVLDIVTGGQETIGLRIPKHPVAQALLQAFGGGIAAPSANRFTHISPTTADAVREELGSKVDLILDGGSCEVGLESTIIDMSTAQPVILRPGMISAKEIADVLGMPVRIAMQPESSIRAPGMHHLHYAPATVTTLINTETIPELLRMLSKKPRTHIIATTEKPDLYAYPTITANTNAEYTIGDLHGNVMKLIYFAVKNAIIQISPDDYATLADIYRKSEELDQHDVTMFENIVTHKMTINDHTSLLRLLGDELADRGRNDYLTLLVLAKLQKANVLEVLISNHGIEVLEAHEEYYDAKEHTYRIDQPFHPRLLSATMHAISMAGLQKLIDEKIVTKEKVAALIETYKFSLKPISYTLSDDEAEITIYAHAPIGLKVLIAMRAKLGFPTMAINKARDFAISIDQINDIFREHLIHGTVHSLFTKEAMFNGYNGGMFSEEDTINNPFAVAMWNRNYDIIYRPQEMQTQEGSFRINFVHGHDLEDPFTALNIYSLDNFVGKAEFFTDIKHTTLTTYGIRRMTEKEFRKIEQPIAIMTYSDMPHAEQAGVKWIKMPDNAAEYAHELYHTLRSLDHQQFKRILIEEVPHSPLWDAIRDRLRKASGGR